VVTTAALVSVSDFSGVTLELGAAYLNPAAHGDVAEVEATVLKVGGAVAVLSCTLTARATGRLVASGRHTKYLPRTAVAPQLAAMQAAAAARTGTPAAPPLNAKL
jgi:acyl-coenzyme A thioesterase PaaI-like protein